MSVGELLVVTGPPAAGKTTVAGLIAAERARSVHLRADEFWAFVASGYVDPWLPEAHAQNEVVISAVCAAAREFCIGGFPVILDGVVGPWFVDELRERIGVGVRVDYAILLPPLSALLANLAGRTGHGFTSVEAAKHMYDDFERAVRGVFARHVIDNGALSASEAAAAVLAAQAEGRLHLNH